MKPKPCPGRFHDWGDAPAGPGAVCVRCGHTYGLRKKREVASIDIHHELPSIDPIEDGEKSPPNAALASRWGGAQIDAVDSKDVDSKAVDNEVDGEQLAKMLQPYVADGLIGLERWIIDWRGYVPKDPDPDQREELHERTGVILAKLLPKVAVGPWSKWAFSITILYASMRVGAQPKPAPMPAGAAASAEPHDLPRPIPISSQRTRSSENSTNGPATDADPLISA